jgi:hypothetical protein
MLGFLPRLFAQSSLFRMAGTGVRELWAPLASGPDFAMRVAKIALARFSSRAAVAIQECAVLFAGASVLNRINIRWRVRRRASAQRRGDALASRGMLEREIAKALRHAEFGAKAGLILIILEPDAGLDVQDAQTLSRLFGVRLRSNTRRDDCVAQLSQTKFAILQRLVRGRGDSDALASRLRSHLSGSFLFEGRSMEAKLQVINQLMLERNCTMASCLAALEADETCADFNRAEFIPGHPSVAGDFIQASGTERFGLRYHPVLHLGQARIGADATNLRWHQTRLGNLHSNNFDLLADEIDHVRTIGGFVQRHTCFGTMSWPVHIRVTVNMSKRQWGDASF